MRRQRRQASSSSTHHRGGGKFRCSSWILTVAVLGMHSHNFVQGQFYPLPEDKLTTDNPEDPQQQNEDTYTASDCPLECDFGTECVRGDQDTSEHMVQPLDGTPLTIHQYLNEDGWHCDCPHGLTGLRCGTVFESCNDGSHKCYNGGKCINGLEDEYGNLQLFCDCKSAIDEEQNLQFVGKYCEEAVPLAIPVSESSNDNGAIDDTTSTCDPSMCVNGSSCKPTPDRTQPCDCPKGVHGKYCEFVEGTVPDCELDCDNGGFCRLGLKPGGTAKSGAKVLDAIQMCECPVEYYGDRCEFEATPCGDEFCYHGSTCFSIQLSDGSTEHMCNCAPGYTDEVHFAGQFCQYPSTSFCTGSDDPNGRQFCTNDGTCPNDSHKPCTCPKGYTGPRCASRTHEAQDDSFYSQCNLDCQNNGTCHKGNKDLEREYRQYESDNSEYRDDTTEPQDSYEHCVCPVGFYGIHCEYERAPDKNQGSNGEFRSDNNENDSLSTVSIISIMVIAVLFSGMAVSFVRMWRQREMAQEIGLGSDEDDGSIPNRVGEKEERTDLTLDVVPEEQTEEIVEGYFEYTDDDIEGEGLSEVKIV